MVPLGSWQWWSFRKDVVWRIVVSPSNQVCGSCEPKQCSISFSLSFQGDSGYCVILVAIWQNGWNPFTNEVRWISGQITIIPKPEFKVIFGGESLTKPPFEGDRSRRFGCYNFPVDELNELDFFLDRFFNLRGLPSHHLKQPKKMGETPTITKRQPLPTSIFRGPIFPCNVSVLMVDPEPQPWQLGSYSGERGPNNIDHWFQEGQFGVPWNHHLRLG